RLRIHLAKGRDRWLTRVSICPEEDVLVTLKTDRRVSKETVGELDLRLVKGKLQVVNKVDLEDYLEGILEPELGTLDLSPEVLKAQIIAARSYVLAMKGEQHHGQGYELCVSPHCQVFGGV